MNKELKPCPFCGSTNVKFNKFFDFFYCVDCGGRTKPYDDDAYQEAKNAWNRRAYIMELENLHKVVKFLREEFKFCTMELIDSDDDIYSWQCSNCKKITRFTHGSPSYLGYKFCPFCGAAIDKEVRDD